MEKHVTYKEVCEEIKKVFAAKGYKNSRMNFTYDLKEYLLVVSFYKSRWCGPWGGDLYGDMGIYFYELHPEGLRHRNSMYSDFYHRIFETEFDKIVDIDKMRCSLIDGLKICDEIIERGAWILFKENKLRGSMPPYALYPRETVPFIYEKTGVKLR